MTWRDGLKNYCPPLCHCSGVQYLMTLRDMTETNNCVMLTIEERALNWNSKVLRDARSLKNWRDAVYFMQNISRIIYGVINVGRKEEEVKKADGAILYKDS